MTIQEVCSALVDFAPLPLQEDYDNVGLQIGLTEGEQVTGALLCLDVTAEVIAEAHNRGLNLVVAHHPLLFRAAKQITNDTVVGNCVMQAIKHNIAVYAAHTNLDRVRDGVNFALAELLGLQNIDFLRAGNIRDAGDGAIGSLPTPCTASEFLQQVKDTLNIVRNINHNAVSPDRPISRVALCGGSGSFLINEAIRQQADVFLTGEVGYHHWAEAENKVMLVEIGHYESEQHVPHLLKSILNAALPALPAFVSEKNTNPIIQ